MGIPNFWPPTADVYFEGEYLTKARLVNGAYQADYPMHQRPRLLELQQRKKLWREETNEWKEKRGEDGALIGVEFSNVRFDLTVLPDDHTCSECSQASDFNVNQASGRHS